MRLQLNAGVARAASAIAMGSLLVGLAGVAHAQPPSTEPASADAPAAAPVPPAVAVEGAVAPARRYTVRASSEVGGYADTDHVFVVTPTVAGSVADPVAGWSVDGRYLVDVVSAASVDIVSTASRRWEEVRHAGTLGGTYKPGTFGVSVSGAGSFEPDYTSLAGGVLLAQDVLDKRLTVLAGYDYGHDVAGRTGTPFSVFSHAIDRHGVKGGASLVMSRSTLVTALVDAVFESGDSSKPYRYIPMFAPGTEVARGASIDTVNALRLAERPLEQLPLSRDRYALTLRLAHRFSASTLRLEERLYHDTWGIDATSTDARFVVDVAPRLQLGPHARVHAQTPVDFWQRVYVVGPGYDFPALRTGDRELGPLVNLTAGGTLRVGLGPSDAPRRWLLGLDVNVTSTQYLDDLYVTHRVSAVSAITLEAEL